jgi:hypothetical protein
MGFFGRLAKLFQIQFSPRTQRRLTRFRDGFLGWIIYPFVLVGKLFAEIGRQVAHWWSLRNMRFLLQGLPAVLLALGALVFGVVVYFQDRNLLATTYKYETEVSLRKVGELERAKKDSAEPLARAETCAHRLAMSSPDDQERYQLARVLLAQKKDAEAHAIMKRLASEGPNGFGPAQLWMAGRLLSSDPLSREQLNAAIGHLE